MSLPKPFLYLITDRKILFPNNQLVNLSVQLNALVELCRAAATAGVDAIQIREKDLSARALCDLVTEILSAVSATKTKVLVNDRLDIALACQAQGVHLRADSLPVEAARKLGGDQFMIGV